MSGYDKVIEAYVKTCGPLRLPEELRERAMRDAIRSPDAAQKTEYKRTGQCTFRLFVGRGNYNIIDMTTFPGGELYVSYHPVNKDELEVVISSKASDNGSLRCQKGTLGINVVTCFKGMMQPGEDYFVELQPLYM